MINNINQEYAVNPAHWESYILRVLFLIVLACHIPFIFFSGKEALLIIIDEIDRKSVSDVLEERIKTLKNVDMKAHKAVMRASNSKGEELDKSEEGKSFEGLDMQMDSFGHKFASNNKRGNGAIDKIIRMSSHQTNIRYTWQHKNS